ncbi:MAG TPA: serine hydrolase domain-containing protein [Candidatus Acidoferrum sp.]|nr:serine hydrolase domain-containing protein [Candidatus Acidoferrum sp.]
MSLADDGSVRSSIGLLSAWVESQMAYNGLPGLSIGILHDQELVWAAGFGRAGLEPARPATPDTLYRIASITKLFTSTAILQLRDAGKLRLDDPLVEHLPWFRIGRAHAEAPETTIRHLLTHTAGLPREAGFPYWTDGEFPTAPQIRERLAAQEAALPTETEWKYSNLGLTLAGEIVAAVSGQAYPEYVADHILEPLGMLRTWVTTPPADHPELATGYTRRLPAGARTAAPFTDGRGITPAANMTTCVSDLARFAMLQFRDGPAGGAQILRGSTLREMQRVHWLEPDWEAGWGLGFRIARTKGKTYVGHGGSLRGYRTIVHLCPADRIGVIVLTNADDGNPSLVADKAFEWVAPAIRKVVAPPAPNAPPAGWERYAGRYRNGWGDVQVLAVDNRLAMLDPSQPDPMLGVTWLHPVAEHAFRSETKNGFGSNGEPVVFEMGGDGRVVRLRIGENFMTPIADW